MPDYIYAVMADGETATALRLIADERWRVLNEEGFTREHDDVHKANELADAAEAYLAADSECWPWELEAFKPSDRLRDLVKAGQFIVAEIERQLRLKAKP